jgi:hypothetical protein
LPALLNDSCPSSLLILFRPDSQPSTNGFSLYIPA